MRFRDDCIYVTKSILCEIIPYNAGARRSENKDDVTNLSPPPRAHFSRKLENRVD